MVMYGAFLCEPIAGSETANTYLARRIYLTMCSYNLYHSSTRHGESHFVKKKKQQTWTIEENTVSFDQWPSTTPGAQKGPLNQGIGNMAVAFRWQSLATVVGQGMYEVLTSLLRAMIHFPTMLTCIGSKTTGMLPPSPLSTLSKVQAKSAAYKARKTRINDIKIMAPLLNFIILSCYEMKDEKCKKKLNQLHCTRLRTMFNSSTTKVT